jgi:hypothetical protein
MIKMEFNEAKLKIEEVDSQRFKLTKHPQLERYRLIDNNTGEVLADNHLIACVRRARRQYHFDNVARKLEEIRNDHRSVEFVPDHDIQIRYR